MLRSQHCLLRIAEKDVSMIGSSRFPLVAARAIIVLAYLPVFAAERALLMRVFPTDVSWGEISLAEGPPTEVSIREDRIAYPFSLMIACTQHQRREDLNDAKEQAIVTPLRRRGAIYFSAQLPGGRNAWKAVIAKLRARLAGLTPETFGTFAQTFGTALIGAEPAVEGSFEGLICMTVEGQSDQGWEVHRRIDKNGGVATGASGFPDSRPVCSKLVGALEGEAPLDVLISRLEVRAQREESLTVDDIHATGEGHAAWPPGAGIEYAEAPEGAKRYTSSGGESGAAWYDEIRPARDDGPPTTRKPYLLRAKARNATIPTSELDSDALLSRWVWRVRDVTLGTEPKTSDHDVAVLDAAFLFVEAHGRTDQEQFEGTIARDFASSDKQPGPELLQGLIKLHLRGLGADAMYVVFCEPTRPREATYCVASACSQILNAEDFCSALASRLDVTSRR